MSKRTDSTRQDTARIRTIDRRQARAVKLGKPVTRSGRLRLA